LNTPERPKGRCPDARALLPAYIENELSPIEIRLVQGHLEICSACRSEETVFRSALGALQSAPKPAHGDLYAGLSARLDRLESKPTFRPRQLRWAGALACLVLAVGVGATIVTNTFLNRIEKPAVSVAGPTATTDKNVVEKAAPTQMAPSDLNSGTIVGAPSVADDKNPVVVDNGTEDPTYQPNDSQPVRETSPRRRNHKPSVDELVNTDFNKVPDSRGRSVEDIINELKKNNRLVIDKTALDVKDPQTNHTPQTGAPQDDEIRAVPVDDPSMPDVAVIVPEKEKKEAVGEKIVRSSRAEGYTKTGRLALIHLTADAAPKPIGRKDLRKDELDETP
jgi:hypothetical protein